MKKPFLMRILTKLKSKMRIISILLIFSMLCLVPSSVASEMNMDSQSYSLANQTGSDNDLLKNNNETNDIIPINGIVATNDGIPKNSTTRTSNYSIPINNTPIKQDFNGSFNANHKKIPKNINSNKQKYTPYKNIYNNNNVLDDTKPLVHAQLKPEDFYFAKDTENFLSSQGIEYLGADIMGLSNLQTLSREDFKPQWITVMLAISMGAILIYFVWSGLLAMFPMKKIKMEYKDIDLYTLYVMVPSLNEKNVVENTIHRFFKEHNEHYKLVVIDDGSNDGTGEILEKIAPQYNNLHIISRVLPNAQKGKGEALNEGLAYIKNLEAGNTQKVIIGVIDADAHIENEDYIKILSVFNGDPDLAMIQTSVGMNIVNQWLHRMQDLEFQSCITLISNVRNFIGNAAGGGNGQFFRLGTFEDKEEVWGTSLLEDFEISTRLLLEGKKTCFLDNITVYQEPVGKIKPLIVQRTRWAQGGLECIPKYGRLIIESPFLTKRAKFEMFFYMNLPIITAIGVIGHAVSLVYNLFIILVLKDPVNIVLLIILILSIVISLIYGTIYGSRTDYGIVKGFLTGATIPLYSVMMIPVCYRSIVRFVTGERKWEKTEHIIKVKV